MTNDEHAELLSELSRLRKAKVQSEFGDIPRSIVLLKNLLESDLSEESRQTLYPLILSESSRSGNPSLQIYWLRRRVRDLPRDPMSIIGLSFWLAINEPANSEEALALAEMAVGLAKSENRQVRYSATNWARIALTLDDYDALHRALTELVADAQSVRDEDQCYEFDFLDQIDTRRFDTELLARYAALKS